MLEIKYSDNAKKSFKDIFYFIALDNPERALSYTYELEAEISKLSRFPNLGKKRTKTTRYLIKPPYIIIYSVHKDFIRIHNIRHGMRKPL